jgi:hypothetical protein
LHELDIKKIVDEWNGTERTAHSPFRMQAPGFQSRLAGLGDAPGTPMSTDEAVVVLRERRAWMDKSFEVAMKARASQAVK